MAAPAAGALYTAPPIPADFAAYPPAAAAQASILSSNGTPLPRLVRPNQLKFVSHFYPDFKQDVFEVEAIVDHRGEGDNREYKVHWKGYPSDEDTWEPVSNLFDAEWSINKYLASLNPVQVARRSHADDGRRAQ